jgi:hypothetical protein
MYAILTKGLLIMNKTRLTILALAALLAIPLWGCAPEIGSNQWCANLKEKPKGDWSMNEAADFKKHCILK